MGVHSVLRRVCRYSIGQSDWVADVQVGDKRGRLPILWTCIVGHTYALVAVLLSRGWRPALYSASMARGLTGAFWAVNNAIVADLGGNQSLGFTVKILCAQLGHGIGWLAAVRILRLELFDYTQVLIACCVTFGAGAMVATRISETLPARQKERDSADGWLNLVVAPYQKLSKDSFLASYCLASFFLMFGFSVVFILRSFVLAVFGWRQGTLESFQGVGGAIAVLSTSFGPLLIRSWTARGVLIRFSCLFTAAQTALVLAPLDPVFVLLPLMAKAAGACIYAASNTFLAERFPNDQGMAQGTFLAVSHLAHSLGHLLYSTMFSAKATGMRQARPFVIGALISWVGLVCFLRAVRLPAPRKPQVLNL